MPIAYVHLLDAVHYRREAFINGFAKLGYIVARGQPCVPLGPQDVAVIWNKTARSEQTMQMARKGEGALMVAENGYFGKDANGHQPYALALDGHNGSGRWYAPDASRLEKVGLAFEPIKPAGDGKIVVADQRGIGSPLMRSPDKFGENTVDLLKRRLPHREVVLRTHPGRHQPTRTLDEDLDGCDALVVWSSNSATLALQKGIPVHYCAPTMVSAGASKPFQPTLTERFTEADRHEAFSRMAWAQWFLDEITSGEALEALLAVHAGALPSISPGLEKL